MQEVTGSTPVFSTKTRPTAGFYIVVRYNKRRRRMLFPFLDTEGLFIDGLPINRFSPIASERYRPATLITTGIRITPASNRNQIELLLKQFSTSWNID